MAIKALMPDAASNAERIARFVREARALAALQHPHGSRCAVRRRLGCNVGVEVTVMGSIQVELDRELIAVLASMRPRFFNRGMGM